MAVMTTARRLIFVLEDDDASTLSCAGVTFTWTAQRQMLTKARTVQEVRNSIVRPVVGVVEFDIVCCCCCFLVRQRICGSVCKLWWRTWGASVVVQKVIETRMIQVFKPRFAFSQLALYLEVHS